MNKLSHQARKTTFLNAIDCGSADNPNACALVSLRKQGTTSILPLQLSAAILSGSKRRLLHFLWDVADKYWKEKMYSLLYIDTDAFSFAYSADSMDEIVRSELQNEWNTVKKAYLVPSSGPDAKRLKREFGLLKQEYVGNVWVSLAPKSYVLLDLATLEQKVSQKGISKNFLNQQLLTLNSFVECLFSADKTSNMFGINCGIKRDGNTMYTYIQQKKGLSFVNKKRLLCPSGIHTLSPSLHKTHFYQRFMSHHCGLNKERVLQMIRRELERHFSSRKPLQRYFLPSL